MSNLIEQALSHRFTCPKCGGTMNLVQVLGAGGGAMSNHTGRDIPQAAHDALVAAVTALGRVPYTSDAVALVEATARAAVEAQGYEWGDVHMIVVPLSESARCVQVMAWTGEELEHTTLTPAPRAEYLEERTPRVCLSQLVHDLRRLCHHHYKIDSMVHVEDILALLPQDSE